MNFIWWDDDEPGGSVRTYTCCGQSFGLLSAFRRHKREAHGYTHGRRPPPTPEMQTEMQRLHQEGWTQVSHKHRRLRSPAGETREFTRREFDAWDALKRVAAMA